MNPRDKSSEWDVVDQASLDSFPASDPPAWGSSHAAASESTCAPDAYLAASRRRRLTRLSLALVATGIAVGGLVMLAPRLLRRVF